VRVQADCVILVVTAARAERPPSSTTRALVASSEPAPRVVDVSTLRDFVTLPPVPGARVSMSHSWIALSRQENASASVPPSITQPLPAEPLGITEWALTDCSARIPD
jgi:hypothetical protein